MKFEQTHCVIDRAFRLLWTGGDWDSFARRNDGLHALGQTALTANILDHLSDSGTRAAVTRMVEAVLDTRRPLRIDYRSDSPETMRRFRLTVQSMRDDRVLMVHELRDAARFKEPLTAWETDPGSDTRKCSFCAAIDRRDGRWQDPGAMRDPHPGRVAFTICGTCQRHVDEAVAAVVEGRKPRLPITGGFGP